MKNLLLSALISAFALQVSAQDTTTTSNRSAKDQRKEEKRQRINAMIKQQEEGVLVFRKQSIFGLELRSNGYGLFYELGKMKSLRRAMIYKIELTEIKHPEEEKSPNGSFVFGNPFVYGKINNFYQAKLGIGQQIMLGQKGNKNGIAVLGIIDGGLSLGLLKPYYLEVVDSNNAPKTIKYEDDTTAFINSPRGGGGFGKGWNELKVKPGAYLRTALRFDFGRFNESVQALEAGVVLEAYSEKIPIMLFKEQDQLFFQVYIALLFGGRK